ncbi:hypothetical protein Cgig2_031338 [Carnegiea gigantea]|uniref:Uncharacterized protein n=1 Tax=Carnegiea gigantea TaxID=171969 RepID=A0A9Q1GPF8_9CARY|nr:hypothetical protein Cgig2_031338 [Carnegiea gigantea]
MGFAPFLKVDVKQIPGKFCKWLMKSFDPYAVCFRLADGQKFPVTAFNVHATLGVPLGGTEITEITKSSMDDEYDEVHAGWQKEWKLQKNAPELTRMPEFIRSQKDEGESFKRNFIIYLVNCFFSEAKNRYYSKPILKYLKDVSQIPSLDWCQFVVDKLITSVRHYKESTATIGKGNDDFYAPSFILTVPLDKLDGEDILVSDASVIVEKEEHYEDLVLDQPKSITKEDRSMSSYSRGLRLSQPNSQSLVPQNTSVPDPTTATVNKDDGIEDDDDGEPCAQRKETSCKEGNEPASKKGEVRKQTGKQRAKNATVKQPGQQQQKLSSNAQHREGQTAREKGKLEKVGPLDAMKKRQPQNLHLAYCSPYVIRLTKLDSELS